MTRAATVTLPLNRPYFPPAVFSHRDSSGDRSAAQPHRVLVVEDDFLVAGELEHWLTQAGFEVIGPARTAEEAIELAGSARPDIAIMDVRLAGAGDGVDAAIHIYRQFGVRSLFATAHSDRQTVTRGREANPLGWVAKPYSPGGLISDIKAYFAE